MAKSTSSDHQNTTQKTKDRATHTYSTKKTRVDPGDSEGRAVLAPLVTCVVLL